MNTSLDNIRIGDLVELPPVQTVIRLEDGRRRSEAIASSFVFTSEVAAHFDVLATALQRDHGQGYFLQGDFGSGKSHFLAALSAWLADAPGSQALDANHAGLAELRTSSRRFLVADLSLVDFRATTLLEQIVVLTIEKALAEQGVDIRLTPLARFREHLRELVTEESIAEQLAALAGIESAGVVQWLNDHPREAYTAGVRLLKQLGLPMPEVLVEDRHETFTRALQVVRDAGFAGLVLLLDELSEFFRSKPDTRRLNEDARMLQFLGERAAADPVWIIGAVQESIERTGDISQVTFRKIKDRFPVKFTLSTVHIRDLISQRLVVHKPESDDMIRRIYEEFRQHFPTFDWSFQHFRDVYPVHPVTLELLEGLGDLFSEHRGIVDFVFSRVAGDERRHIDGILQRPCRELLAPDSIYEHFSQRLMEFSAFNVYPRHIVPHLDDTIDRVLDEEDRDLARRLLRILVLYQIHPTAETPSVRVLTELVACVLAQQDPSLNVQFVAEVLLDPLVEHSRFLTKRKGSAADGLDVTYELTTEDDPTRTFRARVEHVMSGLAPDDSRLLTRILAALPESMAWPGRVVHEQGVVRTVPWRQSRRSVLVLSCEPGAEATVQADIAARLEAGEADVAVVFGLGELQFACEHTALWQLPSPGRAEEVLREYLATMLLAEELRPSNPADAPLLDVATDSLKRLVPAAGQAVLKVLYAGQFDLPDIHVDASARQMRRFDRLLESAAEVLLTRRYPRFSHVSPRGIMPSPRLYQDLLDEFVLPGSITLQEASKRRLTEAIDGLAAPLGLVELRAGAYRFSPDIQVHPLLTALLAMLNPSAPVPRETITTSLRNGPFGLPDDTIAFLLAALTAGGIIALLNRGRTMPLEFLQLVSVGNADAVALGELICEADRETLLAECSFLAPDGGWPAFGLRQQREAWQALLKFSENGVKLCQEVDARLDAFAGFAAFEAFDVSGIRDRLRRLHALVGEIKVSYSARDGIERFLRAWRQSRLNADNIAQLRHLRTFLDRRSEAFIFVQHYVHHRAVEQAAGKAPEVAAARDEVLALLHEPEALVVEEQGRQLEAVFARFRDGYAEFYQRCHAAHGRATAIKLDKHCRRALDVLRRLVAIDALDRPTGLDSWLRQIETPTAVACNRNVAELLLRTPICDCGFVPDNADEPVKPTDPAPLIDASLEQYLDILRSPQVLEAARARAYAVQDVEPDAAKRLRRLVERLGQTETCTATVLLDVMDETTTHEIERALAGRVELEKRSLNTLTARLSGRRLRPAQIRDIVDEWVGRTPAESIIAVEDLTEPSDPRRLQTDVRWWPNLHPTLFPRSPVAERPASPEAFGKALEAEYPADKLQSRLRKLDGAELARFLVTELFHTQALRQAWLLLAERLVPGDEPADTGPIRTHLQAPPANTAVFARTGVLLRLIDLAGTAFPDRLRARLPAAAVLQDPWATDDLKTRCEECIRRIAVHAEDWLALLPATTPIDTADAPLVIILDAVPPDVWLEAAIPAPELPEGTTTEWSRLDSKPTTATSIAALFAMQGDALDEFAARGIHYLRLTGNETGQLIERMPPLDAAGAVAVHIAAFDRAAHGGSMRLHEMPAVLREFLEREVRPVLERCTLLGRRFVLTTDHGLSLTRGKLTHGQGGMFEQAVFRCQWPAFGS